VIRQPVSQIDLMPTILDYTGQRVPEGLHGRSLRPLLDGAEVTWRDHAFCQRADASRMLRTERYKYCYGPKSKLVALYDLQNDPHEDRNLADDPAQAETVRQMHRRLLELMRQDGDPLAERWPVEPSP